MVIGLCETRMLQGCSIGAIVSELPLMYSRCRCRNRARVNVGLSVTVGKIVIYAPFEALYFFKSKF